MHGRCLGGCSYLVLSSRKEYYHVDNDLISNFDFPSLVKKDLWNYRYFSMKSLAEERNPRQDDTQIWPWIIKTLGKEI